MVGRIMAAVVTLLMFSVAPEATAASAVTAIVIQNQTSLRAAPRDSAQQQALLWQGEVLEVRGERMDYLQVYDHKRERGGFVRTSQVRRTTLTAAEAPELLSIVRFVRDTPGAEALGIAFVATYIQAAPAEVVNSEEGMEALDALGTMAERLAWRASSCESLSKAAQATVSAHMEVAERYGIKFTSYERDGRMRVCYDGEAFRRVLGMNSNPEQRARAVLGLTREECVNPDLSPLERRRVDEWRADVLDRVDIPGLPGYVKNRVLMRRAGVWSEVAFARARNGEAAGIAANRALKEFGGINKNELTDDDAATYNEAAMRVNASRWAAVASSARKSAGTAIVTVPGAPGETCLLLVDDKHDVAHPLAKRCTYGIVWMNSSTLNREGNALAVAVQYTATWRELWIFRKGTAGWTINTLPPANTTPEIGYAEFAGWAPGGKEMLVARESRTEGKYKRTFELMRIDTLSVERQASDPGLLGAFQRWQDAAWKQQTLSIR
jgi:hypothetical protein